MSRDLAPWRTPSASTLLYSGFTAGVVSAAGLGAVYGGIIGIVVALTEGGSVLLIPLVGITIGLAWGAVGGTVTSALVIPVVTVWLCMPQVQGLPLGWVRRRAQLLAVLSTALVIYLAVLAADDGSGGIAGLLILYLVPGMLAMGCAAWIAGALVSGFSDWRWWQRTPEPSN